MGAPVDRSMVRMLAGVLVLLGLALLEWLGGQVLGSAWSVQGVLAGLALGAVLLLLALATRRVRGELAAASVAALSAVGELALGAVIVFALAAAAAALLPLPLSASFMQGDRATDFIVFGACALALLVAGRATWRHLRQERRAAAAQLAAARAQAALAQAETALLRAQVEPHFLWNTLAHVQYLATSQPHDAAAMTGHLIRYLRAAVPAGGAGGSIGSEIDSVRAYLEVMKIRMGARLQTSCEVAPELLDVPLAPSFLAEPGIRPLFVTRASSVKPGFPGEVEA